jgi:ADP-heptose:LPS heptosyltransferase
MAPFFVADSLIPDTVTRLVEGYDPVVSFLPDPDGVFERNLRRAGVRNILTGSPRPPSHVRRHATFHLFDALAPLGIVSPCPPPYLPRIVNVNHPYRELIESERPFVLIHPGSGGRIKRWPLARYGALCERVAELGHRPALSFGPADEDIRAEVAGYVRKGNTCMVEHVSLPELAELAACAGVMIGNDSGITHLSAAIGTPTIALFGPTDPAVWGPRGKTTCILWGSERIEGDVALMGREDPAEARPMTDISVDATLDALIGLMDRL